MKTLTAFITFFGICILNGQETTENIQPYPLENTFLWKIEGSKLNQPSYLFGTMHLICKDDFHLNPSVIQALNNTDQLVLELDLNDPQFASDTQKALMTDQKLSQVLSPEDLEIVKNFIIDKTGGPFELYDSVSPFLIYSLTFSNLLQCETTSVDTEIMDLNGNKEVKGLETIQYQVDLMKEVINYDTLAKLIQNFNNDDLIVQQKLYSENNLIELQDYLLKNFKKEPQFYHTLLKVRNENWIKEMPDIMEQTSSFFAVGAGHLIGNFGLIKLLRDQGFTVSPVY